MPRPPIQLILDFDGTLTKKDTLHLVASAGYKKHQSTHLPPLPPWSDIISAYLSDHSAHTTTYAHPPTSRLTLADESTWLNSLQPIESASATRAINAGIFRAVMARDMYDAARDALDQSAVELRPGWASLFRAMRCGDADETSAGRERDTVQVVSVNWSRVFVWSVLWRGAFHQDRSAVDSVRNILARAAVFANEVVSDDSIAAVDISEGESVPMPRGRPVELRTAGDKLTLVRSLASKSGAGLSVYIGDSITDLTCLVAADVGICMRDREMGSGQRELAEVCERIGVLVRRLDEYVDLGQSTSMSEERASNGNSNVGEHGLTTPSTIYYVYDFYEVVQWLDRLG